VSPNPSAARADAQTPTGGVLVVADMSDIDGSSAPHIFACPARGADRRLDAVRIHQELGDTP